MLPYKKNELLLLQLVLFAIAGGIILLYARKKSVKGRFGWAIRKKLEGSMMACGFLLLMLAGPALRENRLNFGMKPAYAAIQLPAQKEQTKAGQFLKKIRKKYPDTSIVLKVLFALALLAATIVIGLGIAGIVCNLSCSGYEVAAAVVLFGGGALLIGGFVLALFRIFEGKKRSVRRRDRRIERREKEASF